MIFINIKQQFMELLWKLAPLAENYDMWIAIAFCYLPVIIFTILAYRSSKSGSMVKEHVPGTPDWVTRWVKSDENIPFVKNAWFKFALVWLLLGSIFFWGALWPDSHDVWFILD